MVIYNEKEIYEFQNTTNIIYRIMNLINNKVYIGQTINTFNIRYGKNKKEGVAAERVLEVYEKSEQKNRHLYNSLKKYGTDNFKVEILKRGLTVDELNYWEEFYIALYNSTDNRYGYNYKKGGENQERVQDYLDVKQSLFDKIQNEKYVDYMDKMLIKLEEKQVNTRLIIDEIRNRRIVIIDERDETKCWTYKNVIEASEIHTGCFSPDTLFTIAKHNEHDTVFDSIKKPNGKGRKIYFEDTIDISEKYIVNLCKHDKQTAKISHRRTKEERKKKQEPINNVKKEKKVYKKRKLTKFTCQCCGKEVVGSKRKYCADCKRKIEFEKRKKAAIECGKIIKVCPTCGKEHWTPSDYCCSDCKRKAKRNKN